jgi:hypothetical protein
MGAQVQNPDGGCVWRFTVESHFEKVEGEKMKRKATERDIYFVAALRRRQAGYAPGVMRLIDARTAKAFKKLVKTKGKGCVK